MLVNVKTIQGPRDYQQDSFFADLMNDAFGVFDGIGGHANGDLASQEAKDAFETFFDLKPVLVEDVQKLFYNLNRKFLAYYDNRGTTATVVWLTQALNESFPDQLCICNVVHTGDTRVTIVNKTKVEDITIDQGMGHQLYYAIGVGVNPIYSSRVINKGDMIVITSDGVHDYLPEKTTVYQEALTQEHAAEYIIEKTEPHTKDNATVITIRF